MSALIGSFTLWAVITIIFCAWLVGYAWCVSRRGAGRPRAGDIVRTRVPLSRPSVSAGAPTPEETSVPHR